MLKNLVRLLAVIILLVGVSSVYTGYAYRAPNATLANELPKVAFLESVAKKMRSLPFKMRTSLNITQKGLFPSFVGGGGGLILISLILFTLSSRKKAQSAPQKKDRKKANADTAAAAGNEQKQGTGLLSDIDQTLSDAENAKGDIFSDIGKVISLSHSTMEEHEIHIVLRRLNPALLDFAEELPHEVQATFAKQALNIYIISTKRSEKDMTPDQFRIQDQRMNELLRETIARRFIPSKTEHLSPNALPLIGKVYTLSEQAKIQQETQSQAEDWHDMSVRNATDIMRLNPHP